MTRFLLTLLTINSLFCFPLMAEDSSSLVDQVEAALPPHVGACVLAIDDGDIVFEHAWGLADVEKKVPCTLATNFRMASVSKQFTAAAVMLLVDRGKLRLDDTLESFFPGYPEYGTRVTVKHLLTHTSGVPAYEDLVPHGTSLQLDDLDVLRLLMDATEARFAPGEKFEYSNSAYVLLGLIVEIVAKRPLHTFMREELFQPLGMNNTLIYQRGLNEVPNRAYGHAQRDSKWVRADQGVTSATRGDGCVYTSLNDYREWLRATDERKLLSAESWEAIFAPQVVSECDGSQYGYGWFIDEYRGAQRIHHNGDSRGFRLCVQRIPARRAAVLVQLNGEFDDAMWPMTKVGERMVDLLIPDRTAK